MDAAIEAQALCPPASLLNTAALAKAFANADAHLSSLSSRLASEQQALKTAVAAVPTQQLDHQVPLLFTPALVAAMQSVACTLTAAAAELSERGAAAQSGLQTPGIDGEMTLARLHPAWLPLQRELQNAAQQCAVPTAAAASAAAADAGGMAQPSSGSGADAAEIVDAVEQGLRAALLWSQAHSAHTGSGAVLGEDAAQLMVATQSVEAVCASPHLHTLQRQLECIAASIAGPAALPELQASGALPQLRGLLAMSQIVASGVAAAAQHAVLLHAAAAKLALQSTAAFAAYLKDGFGSGHADDEAESAAGDAATKGDGAPLSFLASEFSDWV